MDVYCKMFRGCLYVVYHLLVFLEKNLLEFIFINCVFRCSHTGVCVCVFVGIKLLKHHVQT